jgi:hypothetical protein
VPYTGAATPALITAENARELAVGAYTGGEFGWISSGAGAARMAASGSESSRSWVRELYRVIRAGAEAGAKDRTARRASSGAAKTAETTLPGSLGGTLLVHMDLDEKTGHVTGRSQYTDYRDDEFAKVTGEMVFSGTMDAAHVDLKELSVSFVSLRLDTPEGPSTASGFLHFAVNGPEEDLTCDIRQRNEATGEVFWVSGFELHTTTNSDLSTDERLTGTFYHSKYGSVAMETVSAARTGPYEDWPFRGAVAVAGAGGTRAVLTFLTPRVYRVEIDKDGDGTLDQDPGMFQWPGGNRVPWASAGEDLRGGAGWT